MKIDSRELAKLLKTGFEILHKQKGIYFELTSCYTPDGPNYTISNKIRVFCEYKAINDQVRVRADFAWPEILNTILFKRWGAFNDETESKLKPEEVLLLEMLYMFYKIGKNIKERYRSIVHEGEFSYSSEDGTIVNGEWKELGR